MDLGKNAIEEKIFKIIKLNMINKLCYSNLFTLQIHDTIIHLSNESCIWFSEDNCVFGPLKDHFKTIHNTVLHFWGIWCCSQLGKKLTNVRNFLVRSGRCCRCGGRRRNGRCGGWFLTRRPIIVCCC